MSSTQNNYGKKPRNQRVQRDKKKRDENELDTPNSSKALTVTDEKKEGNNEGFAPQPQRANRRQRPNDQTTTKNNENPTPPVSQERKEKVESVMVDHSNLKRETEEIAKLSKKFTKREITSNWHRYSAMEGAEEARHSEEDAPADFSDLLQVPVSRGGHMLLKEEKEWSAVSGSELGGYFALDLKLLGQGLACLPLYEQLHLPKHMLTEEEIKHFDSVAENGKKCYNTDQIEDPNAKVFQLLTNLIQSEEGLEQGPSTETNIKQGVNDHFNILDVENSSKILTNIDSESKHSSTRQMQNSNITVNMKQQIDFACNEHGFKETTLITEEKTENLIESPEIIQQNKNKSHYIDKNIFPADKKPVFLESPVILNDTTKNINEESYEKSYQKVFEKSISPEISFEKSQSVEKLDQNEFDSKGNELNTKISHQPKDKRPNKNILRESSVETEISSSKVREKIKNITLEEDDDDLDYLLSLKKPVDSQPTEELKSVTIKDTSFLPGGAAVNEATTQEKHSELDDWLDSVLED
uniref:Cell death regulator Aven n=1 Tax=Graphocephala atropunctata TaxID=36148 RepID=A0A1B6LDB2_9HEMI